MSGYAIVLVLTIIGTVIASVIYGVISSVMEYHREIGYHRIRLLPTIRYHVERWMDNGKR